MRLIIFSQPSIFIRGHLHAHLFGFILTSPDKHAWSCLDRIHPVLVHQIRPCIYQRIDHLGNPCFCLLDEISRLKSIYHKFTPKSSYLGTSTCGSPSPCADTSFRHPREYVALQPPSDFLLILITRTGVTLALIQGP